MNYAEYRKMMEDRAAMMPIFWAFSDKQFDEALEERNAKVDDVVRVNWGAFCLKKDLAKMHEILNMPNPIKELMQEHDFAVEAFKYEMFNHEYCYDIYQGDYDVLDAIFGKDIVWVDESTTYADYLTTIGCEKCIPFYKEALTMYYDECGEY